MIQVNARQDDLRDQVLVYIIDKDTSDTIPTYGRPRRILRYSDGEPPSWEEVAPGTETEPSLRLGLEVARPLLDALHALFAGPSDTRTSRADLLHERGRVDRLIDALIAPVQTAVIEQNQRGPF